MYQFALLSASAASSSSTTSSSSSLFTLGMLVLMFVVMYFILIRPQKKKQKEEAQMRSTLEVGDTITTIGGIVGRVVTVKEDSIIIETGADRIKVRIKKWAVASNDNPDKQPVQPEKKRGFFSRQPKENSEETK